MEEDKLSSLFGKIWDRKKVNKMFNVQLKFEILIELSENIFEEFANIFLL